MGKRYEELTFTDDFMFCKVMQDESICKEVLELLLGIKIKKIDYIQKQKVVDESYRGKGIRMDVYVEGDEKIFDVEMQTQMPGSLGLRARYYQSMIDMEALDRGQDYEKLRECYVIFICMEDPFSEGLPVYTFQSKCKKKKTVEINDKTTKAFYNASAYTKAENKGLKSFLEYLRSNRTNSGLSQKIEQAVDKARKLERWRMEYMTWNLAITDAEKRAAKEGMARGMARGLEEGNQKKALELACKFMKLGHSAEEAADFAEISVELLKKELSDQKN